MSDTLTAPANSRYKAGTAFHYASWPKNTTITLTNIPGFNQDYRDVVMFPTRDAFDAWINQQSGNYTVPKSSWKKFQDMTLTLDLPVTQAMQYNYVRVANPQLPIAGDVIRPYYYFVTNVAALSGNSTRLTLQLDVWQTFIHDVTLGNCYIEQGHIGIANTNAFNNYGRDYLDMPEGLDIGDEYRIVQTASTEIMNLSTYSVLMCSTIDLTKNPGTVTNPKLTTAPGSMVDGIPSGASFYVFPTPVDFTAFMKAYASYPWITQGIISITLIPPMSRYHSGATLVNVAPDIEVATKYDPTTITFTVSGQTITVTAPGGTVTTETTPTWTIYNYPAGSSAVLSEKLATAWRDSFLNVLDPQYRMLKKFLTSPYSIIELTTFTGSPLIIKPEAWADPDATVQELAAMVPPGQRIAFAPFRYNADPATTPNGADDNGEFLDFATTLTGFVSVPLVNNSDIAYLAANKNGIAFQFQNADWSQQKAMMGAQATNDIANAEIGNTARQASIANQRTNASAALAAQVGASNMLWNTGAQAIGTFQDYADGNGIASGGANMLASEMTGANNLNAGLEQSNIETNARGQSAVSSIQAAGAVRDTNVSLARRVAKGDYQNDVAGIQARLRDAKLMQPSVSGQFGGDAMNLVHNQVKLSARFKLVDKATVRRIGNYWLRYGYAIGAFGSIPSNYQCMTKFTYWKLSETYIVQARIPESFKQAIRGIFEKGVTVWADPSEIGTTALSDNQPLPNISY